MEHLQKKTYSLVVVLAICFAAISILFVSGLQICAICQWFYRSILFVSDLQRTKYQTVLSMRYMPRDLSQIYFQAASVPHCTVFC